MTYSGGDAERASTQEVTAVNSNLSELAHRGFITYENRGPKDRRKVISLRSENLNGKAYTLPDGAHESYIRVPEELWTNGFLARMSGPGLLLYLVLLDMAGKEEHSFTVSPAVASSRYGISDTTRKRGLKNLVGIGAAEVETKQHFTAENQRRRVNTYELTYPLWPVHWKTPASGPPTEQPSAPGAKQPPKRGVITL